MKSDIAIEFENVGKQYRLGRIGTGTLAHDLNRWLKTTVLRQEDPYLLVGEINDREKKGRSEYVWALKDISFKISKGDIVGIIGRNGSGKSTMLKLLSHITAPTVGKIGVNGRIASLLEVGTGFHPEMTARENIYMNGSIMGMRTNEISAKLDEIVDFAGVERYLDTPVKRFSSGMTVRLGFAVAAFLEPEILVVDEVLAVGDAEFQKKALGKIHDISRGDGRTVLFVSHNMASIKNLCKKGILLNNGIISYMGTAEECVDRYIGCNDIEKNSVVVFGPKDHASWVAREIEFLEMRILNNPNAIATDEDLDFILKIRRNASYVKSCCYSVFFLDTENRAIEQYVTEMYDVPSDREEYEVRLHIRDHFLTKGTYIVKIEMGMKEFSSVTTNFDQIDRAMPIEVKYIDSDEKKEYSAWQRSWGGYVSHYHNNITAEIC
ncbi:MAG: ABC transporter ATP-binding protein [Candidatus Cryptobacteroides sp.]